MRIDVPAHVVVRRSRESGETSPLRKNGAWSEIGENPISGERPAVHPRRHDEPDVQADAFTRA
jgi:hypothetical protein